MRARTRHPHLAAAASRAYGLMMYLYPTDFRREFGCELSLTFRNQVEDVLDDGGPLTWLAFAGHVAVDTIRAHHVLLVTARRAEESPSLLGLRGVAAARGCLDRAADVQFIFFVAGFLLTCVSWYAFFVVLPALVS